VLSVTPPRADGEAHHTIEPATERKRPMTLRTDRGALVEFEEKALQEADDCWTVTGYGSVFNNTDLGNDAVVNGAFKKSLDKHGMPLLLFNHKMEDAPIGTIVEAKEDKRGLWFKAELPKDDSFVSGRIVPQLKRRGLRGTSIGYKTIQSERRKGDNVRLLKELRLYEISIVNMPMNPEAGVDTVKGLIGFQDLPVDLKTSSWDAAAALARVTAHFGDNFDELKSAFLFVDEEKQVEQWEPRLLVADIVDGKLVANRVALYKANAALLGARGGVQIPEDAVEAVKGHIARYFDRIGVEAPEEKLSVAEYDALDVGEREVRLKSLGISQSLAKKFVSGQRDADRRPNGTSGQNEDASELLKSLAALIGSTATAIQQKPPATGK
jgi:HK97 family phage prohead protease